MGSRDARSRLLRRAARADISVPDPLADRLAAFLELLLRWNRKINLTSLDNLDEAIDRLLLEPLAAARHIGPEPGRLLDIGSGGGSPAIPLALALPQLDLTMVEIKARKSAFLREAIRVLHLPHAAVQTTAYRELLSQDGHRGAYTAASMRAVRVEDAAFRAIAQLLAPGGQLLLFRGPSGPDEVPGVSPLKWSATHPLLESLRSRVSLFRKAA